MTDFYKFYYFIKNVSSINRILKINKFPNSFIVKFFFKLCRILYLINMEINMEIKKNGSIFEIELLVKPDHRSY